MKCHVAASTQNQAFNSLLFLFRHALKRDFGELRDVPRAKKSLYVPVVLSRAEIDAIVQHLYHPYSLIVKLLFGCGLRLFECLQLRVRDFNYDAGVLTVHGKGKKDRTVPLPETIMDEPQRQMKRVSDLHANDLGEGYDGVFLDDAVERKWADCDRAARFRRLLTRAPVPGHTPGASRLSSPAVLTGTGSRNFHLAFYVVTSEEGSASCRSQEKKPQAAIDRTISSTPTPKTRLPTVWSQARRLTFSSR